MRRPARDRRRDGRRHGENNGQNAMRDVTVLNTGPRSEQRGSKYFVMIKYKYVFIIFKYNVYNFHNNLLMS